MLMDTSLNQVVIPNKMNFINQKKGVYASTCIYGLPTNKIKCPLKFGFNITTNMYYNQKNSNDSSESSESTSIKKRKMSSGKFKVFFTLWDRNNLDNKLDWKKLAVWSSSAFGILSHNDQLHINKINNNSLLPECIFPNLIPENTKFPLSLVGSFPSGVASFQVIFSKEGEEDKMIIFKQQTIKMIVGFSPPLKPGYFTIFINHNNIQHQCSTSLSVVNQEEWKKLTC